MVTTGILEEIGLAFCLGIIMKGADLCNEHKCHYFIGDKYVLGTLWGIIGIILINNNCFLSTAIIALLLSYILRAKIDYINHGIGSTLILIYFLFNLHEKPECFYYNRFIYLFAAFSITGLFHDIFPKLIEKFVKITNLASSLIDNNTMTEIIHSLLNYILIPLTFSFFWNEPSLVVCFSLFAIGYEVSRALGPKFRKERITTNV